MRSRLCQPRIGLRVDWQPRPRRVLLGPCRSATARFRCRRSSRKAGRTPPPRVRARPRPLRPPRPLPVPPECGSARRV